MAPSPELRADARASVERILAAAPDVLAAEPYAGLQRIADASGLHRATVYRHFASREALVMVLYTAWLADIGGVFTTVDTAAPDVLLELRRVTIEVYERNLVWKAYAWAPSYPPEFAPVRDMIVSQFERLFQRGREEGVLRADMSVVDLHTAWGVPVLYMAGRIVEGSVTLDEAVDFTLRLIRPPG